MSGLPIRPSFQDLSPDGSLSEPRHQKQQTWYTRINMKSLFLGTMSNTSWSSWISDRYCGILRYFVMEKPAWLPHLRALGALWRVPMAKPSWNGRHTVEPAGFTTGTRFLGILATWKPKESEVMFWSCHMLQPNQTKVILRLGSLIVHQPHLVKKSWSPESLLASVLGFNIASQRATAFWRC